MKVPFGGFEDDGPLITEDSDPIRLLAEIAECARSGQAMRPYLAEWFFRTWKAGRLAVMPPPLGGRPETEGFATQEAALELFDKLVGEGMRVGKATLKVIRQLKLDVKESTVDSWRKARREHRKLDAEDAEKPILQAMARSKTAALLLFEELKLSGVSAEDALQIVHSRPMQEVLPAIDTLRAWQERESAYSRRPPMGQQPPTGC